MFAWAIIISNVNCHPFFLPATLRPPCLPRIRAAPPGVLQPKIAPPSPWDAASAAVMGDGRGAPQPAAGIALQVAWQLLGADPTFLLPLPQTHGLMGHETEPASEVGHSGL